LGMMIPIQGESSMNNLAGICIFITIMTALSIPIIAILKRKPGNPKLEERIGELEARLRTLEQENVNKTLELELLRKELSFKVKLIEKD